MRHEQFHQSNFAFFAGQPQSILVDHTCSNAQLAWSMLITLAAIFSSIWWHKNPPLGLFPMGNQSESAVRLPVLKAKRLGRDGDETIISCLKAAALNDGRKVFRGAAGKCG